MKNKFLGILIITAFVITIPSIVIIQSCSWNEQVKPTGVCFSQDVLPLVQTYCGKGGCHDGSDSTGLKGLLTYDQIMQYVKAGHPSRSELITSIEAGGDDHMPPNPEPQLTPKQISLLKQWVGEGALEVGFCNEPCDTSHVTYSGSIVPLLQNDCLGCHTGTSSISGYDLSTYEGVKAEVDDGSLWGDVTWDPDFVPMPNNGNMLSNCKLRTIRIWLNDGAPNN